MSDEIPQSSIDAIGQMMSEVAVPIVANDHGRVAHHATGMLFEFGDTRFLVTARHAYLEARKHRASLLVPSDCVPHKAYRLPGKFLYLEETALDLDLAVIPIPVDFQKHFNAHRWVKTTDFVCDTLRPGTFCGVWGHFANDSHPWPASGTDFSKPQPPAGRHGVYVSQIVELYRQPENWNSVCHISAIGDILWASYRGKTTKKPSSIIGFSGAPVAVFQGSPYDPNFSPYPLSIVGFQSAVIPLDDPNKHQTLKIISWQSLKFLLQTHTVAGTLPQTSPSADSE
jgi:hypothetical protein